jgi:hypothetical protein
MKKLGFILFLCVGFFLHGLGQITNSVKPNLSELKIEKEAEYDRILLENSSYLDVAGQPELPIYIKSYAIPIDAKVTGIKINSVQKQKMEGSYYIYPTQPPIPISTDEEIPHSGLLNQTVYNSLSPYPGKYAEIVSDQYEYGYHIVTLRIFPVEYIPKNREIYICDIDYEIEYTIEMFDSKGNVLQTLFPINKEQVDIDLSEYVPGIYYLIIDFHKSSELHKIIKQ